jgi:LmbE family N-acetylglucosaminyl deacetylase
MNVKRLRVFSILALGLAVGSLPVHAQETEYRGAPAMGLALRRLGTSARVLMIGAHPDDENNAVLTALALGKGADVAYLSFTRGDGGQDLIGPELKEGLGLIRSEELLAARRLDGARQYFGREYDYGFSKSADEAFTHWSREAMLEDAVLVIRKFRPDVILSVWSGTPRDGHGQHQAAGIIAKEAFAAAADPTKFPDQIRAGLPAHETSYLMQATWRPAGDVSSWLQTGEFDPLFGQSYFQISMDSRSRHRSQDQGSAQTPGPQRTAVIALAGAVPANAASIFDGLPTTLSGVAEADGASAPVLASIRRFETEVGQATTSWNPLRPVDALSLLEAALAALDDAVAKVGDGPAAGKLRFRLETERDQAVSAVLLAAAVRLDATAETPRVVPGQDFEMSLRLWNGSSNPVSVSRLEPSLPQGWSAAAKDPLPASVAPGQMAVRRFTVKLPPGAQVSEAYYLRSPRKGDLYVWPNDVAVEGEPFAPPPVRALATVSLAGRSIDLPATGTYVDVDKALGERRLPILVVPAINVLVQPEVAVAPLTSAASDGGGPEGGRITVTLSSQSGKEAAGTVQVRAPAGWSVEPASSPASLSASGEPLTLGFHVTPPQNTPAGRYPVDVEFRTDTGQRYARGFTTIDYPHIRPHLLFRDATSTFSAFPVAVAPGLRVGYIEGAGDDGAAALARLGVSVEPIGSEALESGDLSRFDVIVAGIRAYEVRQDLVASNKRLLDWVRQGGTYIVQYNKQEFARGDFAPYPVSIGGSDRVTDEDSPVTLLDPSHPILSSPNRIGPDDFKGWIQERGLYFPNKWDDRYEPLLEMNDPGEAPQKGILLVTKYGRGTYVYVTLSLFRELPEGVPGAYRLLANLVSLGAK